MKILDEHKEHLFWAGENYVQIVTTVIARFNKKTGVLVVDCDAKLNKPIKGLVEDRRHLHSTNLNAAVRMAIAHADAWHQEQYQFLLNNGYSVVPGKEHYIDLVFGVRRGDDLTGVEQC